MTSFIRTAQREEEPWYIEEILRRSDHFIPLRFQPTRAHPGDFIYLAYRGGIVGRARIREIAVADREARIGSDRSPYPAEYLVWYAGGWQRPPRSIPFRGYQGIRYLDAVRLQGLDAEKW